MTATITRRPHNHARLTALLASTALVGTGLMPGTVLVLSATSALAVLVGMAAPARATDYTWTGATSTWEANANWGGAGFPQTAADGAIFGAAGNLTPTLSTNIIANNLTFQPGAQAYTVTISAGSLTLEGAGLTNLSAVTQTITNGVVLNFTNSSTMAGSVTINNTAANSSTRFYNTSTAGSATINNNGTLSQTIFDDDSNAGTAYLYAYGSSSAIRFRQNSSAANASINVANSNAELTFADSSTAGSASITSSGIVTFSNNSTAGNATIELNAGATAFLSDTSTGAGARFIVKAGATVDISSATTGISLGSIEDDGSILLGSKILTVGATGRSTSFTGTIDGAGGSLTKVGTGTLTLTGANTYSGGTTFAGGAISVSSDANLGAAGGRLTFKGGTLQTTAGFSSARDVLLDTGGGILQVDTGMLELSGDISDSGATPGGLTKRGAGTLRLAGSNNYSGLTAIEAGTLQVAPTGILSTDSRHDIAAGATLDLNGHLFAAIGSLTGAGTVTTTAGDARLITGLDNTTATFAGVIKDGAAGKVEVWVSGLGSTAATIFTGANTYSGGTVICNCATLQIGNGGTTGSIIGDVTNGGTLIFNRSNNYAFAGVIADDSLDAGKLIQAGTGNTILTGLNTYTGETSVNAGTLSVNGSIASSSLTTVNASGTLGGTGTVGNVLINGGTLAPGNSIGTLTVAGNLVFTAASHYMVELDPNGSDRTNVTGTATLGGATVNASFAAGSYVAKKYTILNAAGGLGGSAFNALVSTNLPTNFKSSLSYDSSNVFLDLDLAFIRPATAGAGSNQSAVGQALIDSFNRNGGIPLVYGGLTASGLTQVSGETATGSQQTTFNAMTQFMGVMTDPFTADRNDAPAPMAYAPQRSASPRDAYAAITKAMPRTPVFEQRWNVWASGFGGSQSTDGNSVTGSNSTTSRIYGAAAGADVWLSPATLAGISMAGGATNFSVSQGGSGQSDLVQVGGFIRHAIGTGYVSAAAAYGWQDITTDRTVTVAGIDRLRARFNANSFAGRVEAGSSFVETWTNGIGLTPYAALQITAIDLPAYAENVVAGSNAFALTYTGKTVTAPRTELGLRSDKAFALDGALLTLRGRAAWAYDANTDRNAQATFLALPGASFVVNGAAASRNSALTSASAEVAWTNGFALAATFEGEFSDTTRSYAGKGVVRYTW